MAEVPEFKARKIKFKAWDTESRLLMRLNSIECNKGELIKKNHVLLQFTGMTDKNGDEIYEMDVLLISDQKYVVFWEEVKNGWFYYPLKSPKEQQHFLAGQAEKMVRLGSVFELNSETDDNRRKK